MKKKTTKLDRTRPPIETFHQSFSVLSGYVKITDLVFYDEAGRIVQTMVCSPIDLDRAHFSGCTRLQAKGSHFDDYVDLTGSDPVVRPRPEIESLDALPTPATVIVTCRASGAVGTYTVEDGSFDYDDLPGTYDVRVNSWPHHDAHFVLEITP